MEIFIAWSGKRSYALALTIRKWLPKVIQCLKPWLSDYDLDKGTKWREELGDVLTRHSIGIICVTPERQNSPWLLFEAGALSKEIDSAKNRVYTILFGMEPSDLNEPLNQFQYTIASKYDMFKLCRSLNNLCEHPLPENDLEEQFNIKWPIFEKLLDEEMPQDIICIEPRNLHDILNALVKKGIPEPVYGREVQFESGFESHVIFHSITELAKKRILIFGRKNRKLFDKEHLDFFDSLDKRIKSGFDFRCLFLDPSSPEHILSSAHQDSDFPLQLSNCINNAVNLLNLVGVEPDKVCRTYKTQRHFSIIIVDEAVLYTPIELSPEGKPEKLTRCAFSVVGAETPIGQKLIRTFESIWEKGISII